MKASEGSVLRTPLFTTNNRQSSSLGHLPTEPGTPERAGWAQLPRMRLSPSCVRGRGLDRGRRGRVGWGIVTRGRCFPAPAPLRGSPPCSLSSVFLFSFASAAVLGLVPEHGCKEFSNCDLSQMKALSLSRCSRNWGSNFHPGPVP